MEKDKDTAPKRILRRRKPNSGSGYKPAPVPDKPIPDFYYFQVHYQPVPGARKAHFDAVGPRLLERTHEMIRHGQLLISGGYPSSIGGLWVLKVKNRAEAERLVMDHPAVACNLLTYRLIELQDPEGMVVHEARIQAIEPADESGTADK
jgi:hypothetical protein